MIQIMLIFDKIAKSIQTYKYESILEDLFSLCINEHYKFEKKLILFLQKINKKLFSIFNFDNIIYVDIYINKGGEL